MCNAVAKLNDLRKLPNEGVTIPDDFYIPNKGFVALGHSDGDAYHWAKQKARKMH